MKSLYVMIIPLIGLILAHYSVNQVSFWIISFVVLVFITILKVISSGEYNGDNRNEDLKIASAIIDIHGHCYNELVADHFYSYNGRKIIDELELKSGMYMEEIVTYYGA